MRSSIACIVCRRSKTKCDNNGVRDANGNLAPCKSCVASKKTCDYSPSTPATNGQSQRRESTAATAGDEAPQRKRKRHAVPTATTNPYRGKCKLGTLEDAHLSPLLTSKVWDELWAIHEKHYAMEFPFLHKRTFLGPLQKLPPVSSSESGPNPSTQRTHDPALILAFLTQTSPFHPELVAQTGSAHETADFYAAAAHNYLDHKFQRQGEAAMQQIQAFLMLGYHEWSAYHGRSGYMLIQQGVAFAKTNDYMYDEDYDIIHHSKDAASRRDRFIYQESRRRTFWSCFIMDRYLSVGRRRTKIIQLDDLKGTIQIPCSEKNFISGRAVRTRYFGESDEEYAKRRQQSDDKTLRRNGGQKSDRIEWEDREDDGMLGRYIFTLDLFTDVNKWANKGGRRSEPADIGPWNPDTQYYHLDKRLSRIREDLPEELRLSPINTENHIYGAPSAASRTYFLIHAILMLCKTYLAPEYLPTFGFKLTKPQGPLDEPLVTEQPPADQPDYWVEKAKDCFEYVRDFVSVLQSFKDRDLVVESPFMGHAVWRAAWAAMYCHHVPKMDPSNALSSKLDPNAWDVTNLVLDSMKKKFQIAKAYSAALATDASYYTEKRRQWINNGGSPQSTVSESDGGLHEYSMKFETMHKQFGSLQADEKYLSQPYDKPYSKLSKLELENDPEEPHSPVMVFKTDGDEPRRSTSTAPSISASFTPVNPLGAATPAQREHTNRHPEGANLNRSSYEHPQRSQQQQQQPSQDYSGQPRQYGQPSAYGYHNGTLVFPEPASHYGVTPLPYAAGSESDQGPVSAIHSEQQQQILRDLQKEGNRSLNINDTNFFEVDSTSFDTNYYPFGQMQPQTQYLQDPPGSYTMYSNQWSGS